jgi:hypothetical protein
MRHDSRNPLGLLAEGVSYLRDELFRPLLQARATRWLFRQNLKRVPGLMVPCKPVSGLRSLLADLD